MPISIDGAGTISGVDLATSGFGRVLQVVLATDSNDRTTTSGSFVDVTGMSVTITPKKSTSRIVIQSVFRYVKGTGTSGSLGIFALADSSNILLSGAQGIAVGSDDTGNSLRGGAVLVGSVLPASTSALTYKLRFSVIGTASLLVQNGSCTGQMYAIEVAA